MVKILLAKILKTVQLVLVILVSRVKMVKIVSISTNVWMKIAVPGTMNIVKTQLDRSNAFVMMVLSVMKTEIVSTSMSA